MISDLLWTGRNIGPMSREALDAVGWPTDVEEIRIEFKSGAYTLNGTPVTGTDATLVYNAWRCDPQDFSEEASELLVEYMRRAITVRRLLEGTAA